MNCYGLIKVFVEAHTKKDGSKFNSYRGSISKKNEAGEYENAYFNVELAIPEKKKDKFFTLEAGKSYRLIADGYMATNTFTTKDGEKVTNLKYVITSYVVLDEKANKVVEKTGEEVIHA